MDALCLRRHVAFRIEVFAEGASRWHMVQQFQGGDLDDAVAGGRIEAGGFGVENDLAHHTSLFRAAPGRQALRRRSPPVRNSLTMPASWRKLCRLPRPVCTTKSARRRFSASGSWRARIERRLAPVMPARPSTPPPLPPPGPPP